MILANLILSALIPSDYSALEKAISVLERQIDSLDNSSLPLEHWLPWFTGVVALGVLMELWVIRHERREAMDAWRRGIIRPPDRPSTAIYVFEIASVLLITAGIVGELWVGVRITSISGTLRSKNSELRSESDHLVAFVEHQSGNAQASADCASEAAKEAGQNAEKLRAFLIKFNEATAPLSLTPQQIKEMSNELRPFADPKVPIRIITTRARPWMLSLQIAEAIEGAGFSRPQFVFKDATSPEISMGAPDNDVHLWQTMERIEAPIVKRFGLWGPLQVLPPGYPITINVGEHLTGPIPPIPVPVPHQPCTANEKASPQASKLPADAPLLLHPFSRRASCAATVRCVRVHSHHLENS